MGTRFLASKECPTHPKIKEWLLQLSETDTMMIQRSIKNAERVVKTDYTQRVLEMEEKGASLDELIPLLSGDKQKAAYISGDVSDAVMSVGQVIGLIHEIPSVREIIEGIISQAKLISQRLYNICK